MADLVVTVPRDLWLNWILEGDAAGEPDSGEEWGFFVGKRRPEAEPGERLYIVAWDLLRGWAPITRIADTPRGWAICRKGGAVATQLLDRPIAGFRGWHMRWWDRAVEQPFDNWMLAGLPEKLPRSMAEDLEEVRRLQARLDELRRGRHG